MSGHSSLLPLPHPYVVPGGRFREVYYWDSYFTMLGLEADGRHELVRDVVENFAFEIDCYGHVPTGNRSYYPSRSQPPFFSLMVDLVARREGDKSYVNYLPQLKAECDYWMDGFAALAPNQGYRRVVRLADGTLLNRYWDDRPEPRDESYREDVKAGSERRADPAGVYRSLRAGAESGWDFSSRWLADGRHPTPSGPISWPRWTSTVSWFTSSERSPRPTGSRATQARRPGLPRSRVVARRQSAGSCGIDDLACSSTTYGNGRKRRCP
jgi:alpha,alpha-trehalase